MFNVGDVVRLNSGGPIMTVGTIEDGENMYCIWFDGAKQTGSTFPAATLEKYVKPGPSSVGRGDF